MNVASRSAPGSPSNGDGGIMIEGVAGVEAAAGIKNIRPVMSPDASQRLVQLSNDWSSSRSAPVSPQGHSNSLCYCASVALLLYSVSSG